jgi:hypothetical protein
VIPGTRHHGPGTPNRHPGTRPVGSREHQRRPGKRAEAGRGGYAQTATGRRGRRHRRFGCPGTSAPPRRRAAVLARASSAKHPATPRTQRHQMNAPSEKTQVSGTGRHRRDGSEWTLNPQVLGSSPRGGTAEGPGQRPWPGPSTVTGGLAAANRWRPWCRYPPLTPSVTPARRRVVVPEAADPRSSGAGASGAWVARARLTAARATAMRCAAPEPRAAPRAAASAQRRTSQTALIRPTHRPSTHPRPAQRILTLTDEPYALYRNTDPRCGPGRAGHHGVGQRSRLRARR